MPQNRWLRRGRRASLHPETDYVEIYRRLTTYDFPWDLNQALSLALFRTYAVPSIGRLLDETAQFQTATQKRYDDTALLLEAPLVHGFDSETGRAAIRRINQMHRMYDITDDDMRYVLATFVVVPKRWLDDFGWRRMTTEEIRASVNYYRRLGRHLAIPDIPETYTAFETLMDDYEARHFAFDAGARRVADSTLALLVSFYPRIAAPAVERFSRALMDPALLAAFAYAEPGPTTRRLAVAALRARARLLALAPARRQPKTVIDSPRVKSYDHGYDVRELGTFPPPPSAGSSRGSVPGCPVPTRVRSA